MFIALAHIPTESVENLFNDVIMAQAPFHEIPQSQQLCDYYVETYVDGQNARFPVATWNHYESDVRTINAVEGWHNKLNDKCGRAHPNVFSAIETLQKEQEEVEVKILQLRNGASAPPKRRKYITFNNKINRLHQRFQQGEISLTELLGAVANIVNV